MDRRLIAVTGATGHVGGNLVRVLLERRRRVRALVLPDDPAQTLVGLDVERVHGRIDDLPSLRDAFDGADVVFHLAARISVSDREDPLLRAINVDGVRNVVTACLDRKVRRLVHVSSFHALSPLTSGQPIDERAEFCDGVPGVPPYNRSKAEGEREVSAGIARGLDAVIVSPTGVIGPNDPAPSRMGRFFLDLCARRLPGTVRGGSNWVDVRDLVAGLLAAEARGRTGERYILGGHFASLQDLALLVEQAFGAAPPLLDAPIGLARLVAPIATFWAKTLEREALFTTSSLYALFNYQRISWAKAAHELGYRARPLRRTVADTIARFRQAGMLPSTGEESLP